MRIYLAISTALLVLLLFVPACGGGSGGGMATPGVAGFVTSPEIEGNNTAGTANPLTLGEAGTGSLAVAGDVDFWSFSVGGAGYVRIQLFALRLDQATWNAIPNAAVITLFDTDGVTRIAEHDLDGTTFPSAPTGGFFDRDMEFVRLDAAGTYFVRVAQDLPGVAGGAYAVAISDVTVTGTQSETEASNATGVNDSVATSEPLLPGVMLGFVPTPADVDFYSITVAQVPAIIRVETKAWRLGASGPGATDLRQLAVRLLAPNGATVLANSTFGYGFDTITSVAVGTAGTYYVRVIPAGAASLGRYQLHLELQAVGNINEAEANNTAGTANALQPGQFVNAMTGAGDVDFFSFMGTAGDMRAIRLWAASNHAAGTTDILVSVLAPDGVTLLPLSGPSGALGSLREIRFILQQSGTHFVRVLPGAPPVSPYILRNVLNKAAQTEIETNNALVDANSFDGNGRAAGAINPVADVDWYSYTASAGELVTIRCFAAPSAGGVDLLRDGYGSALDPVLTALDPGGATLATSTRFPAGFRNAIGLVGRVPSVEVSFVAPTTDTYFVRVGNAVGAGGATYYYLLERR